jgi:hypothetical protein
MDAVLNNHSGEAGRQPAFPLFPQFESVDLPQSVFLWDRLADGSEVKRKVFPVRAWQGIVTPLPDASEARLVARSLAYDLNVSIHGGQVLPAAETNQLKTLPWEPRLTDPNVSFDVLVLEFDDGSHPWVFSLSPAIVQRVDRHHPHLRSDRLLELPSRTLSGFCVYSAADFKFDPKSSNLSDFLAQVSIFLAKHVVWLKTLCLVDTSGNVVHDGREHNLISSISVDTFWQINPTKQARWAGVWPGTPAANGVNHLKLDPNGECWCGKGKLYKDCCLLWEATFYK